MAYERARKGSIETTQEVEIYFNFVGRYVPPHFGEVNLTPEEQEALRKKEERKDRLHQNYLRRKASGKQKEYEDRIKTEKRRQMEAKKAALRAEDNSGSLPSLPAFYQLVKICKLPVDRYFFPVDAGQEDKERERAAHKLELCPKEYLPIIEAAIDGAISLKETEEA